MSLLQPCEYILSCQLWFPWLYNSRFCNIEFIHRIVKYVYRPTQIQGNPGPRLRQLCLLIRGAVLPLTGRAVFTERDIIEMEL